MSWGLPTSHGATSEQVSDTDVVLTITTNNVPVGAVLFVGASSDNAGSGETTFHTITDSQGHTWTRVKEASGRSGAGGNTGATGSIWRTVITTELVAGVDTITLTTASARVNKILAAHSFSPTGGFGAQDDAVHALGASTTPSVTSATLASAERLWIGLLAIEYGNTNLTEDADYTTLNNITTDAGGDSADLEMIWGYRIATLTADTYNPTSTVAQDFGIIIAAFSEDAGGASTYTLTADPGSVAITGTDATLTHETIVDGDPGAVSITGTDANLIYTPAVGGTLVADPGAFSITGIAATLILERRLVAEPGEFLITGTPAGFLPEPSSSRGRRGLHLGLSLSL